MFQARIYVTLKESILDPQGAAVKHALNNMNYGNIGTVRMGKMIQFDIEESDKSTAENQLKEMCEKILTNPVIENYSYELNG